MPIEVRKITHNTIIQIVGKVVATVITLFSLRYLIGYVSEGVYANFATAQAFLTFFSVLADMGLYMVFMQEIAKPGTYEQKKSTLGNIVSLRLCSALLFFGIAPILALLFFHNYSTETQHLILVGTLAYIPLTINQLYVALFQKELATHKIVGAEIVGRLVYLGIIVGVSIVGGTITHIMIGLILGNIVHFSITWILSRGYVRIPLQWNAEMWKKILLRAWPLAVAIVLNLIYFKIDALMLSKMKGELAVAVYSIAYKVLEVTTILPSLLLGLILPYLTKYAKTSTKEFRQTFEQALFAMTTLAVPVIVGGIMLATPIVLLLSDGKFPESAPVLKLLMVATGIIFFGNLFNHGIIAIEKQKSITWVYAIGAALSIITNLIAIPRYSYIGAAVTTIGVEGVVMLLVGILLFRHRKWSWPVLQLLKTVFATVIMGVVLWYTKEWPIYMTFPLGAATYGIMLYTLKGVPKTFLSSLLPKKT